MLVLLLALIEVHVTYEVQDVVFLYFHCIRSLHELIDDFSRNILVPSPVVEVVEERLLDRLHIKARGANGHRGER